MKKKTNEFSYSFVNMSVLYELYAHYDTVEY